MDAFEAVSLPELSPLAGKKHFSVAEANRALALVQRVVTDVVDEYRHLRQLHADCRALDAEGQAARAEEVRREYARLADRLSERNEELEQIGCVLKDYHLGLVDFPALAEEREVCLCWRCGEKAVAYWHDAQRGCVERRPIEGAWDERSDPRP